jgi:hypothetical protein
MQANRDKDISHQVIPNTRSVTGCSEWLFVLDNFHYEHPLFFSLCRKIVTNI